MAGIHADDFWATQRNITDPIHGSFDVPIQLFSIIDTPQFQRLRDIKQMGTAHYVFPTAVNNRFSHCLGTSHLARSWMEQFRIRQPELEIDDRLTNLVSTAGLIHDLGHGCFSHTFEHWMHSIGHKDWDHEVMGGKLFEHIIDKRHLDWSQQDIRTVQDSVVGNHHAENPWLSQIVANHDTGIDVDKFDYIPRDCHYLGLQTPFHPKRLMEHSRVIDGNIAFLRKEAWTVYELFQSRFSLHRRAYQHRLSNAIDYMIFDLLSAANAPLGLANWATDVSRYHLLTDSILSTIRLSTKRNLATARSIVDRLDNRDLYVMASEFIVAQDHAEELTKISAADIVACQTDSNLRQDDVIFHVGKINFGQGPRNPIDNTHFYSKHNVDGTFYLNPRSDISTLLPEICQEHIVRVYVRYPALQEAAQRAVANLLKRHHFKNISLTRSKS
jgi:HD superfamily phosphohydrolase